MRPERNLIERKDLQSNGQAVRVPVRVQIPENAPELAKFLAVLPSLAEHVKKDILAQAVTALSLPEHVKKTILGLVESFGQPGK